MPSPEIDQCVTQICELGCTRVEEIISLLQQSATPPETATLNPMQRQQVLQELQAIMAVYTPRKGDKGCK